MEETRISLDDLRQKIDRLNHVVISSIRKRRPELYIGAAAVVAAAVCIGYFAGKRRGRRR